MVIAPLVFSSPTLVCLLLITFPFFLLAVVTVEIPLLDAGDLSHSLVLLIGEMWPLNLTGSPIGVLETHTVKLCKRKCGLQL